VEIWAGFYGRDMEFLGREPRKSRKSLKHPAGMTAGLGQPEICKSEVVMKILKISHSR